MLNIAMVSKWHVHARGYAKQALETGKVKITAVWDDDEARGKAWANELGVDFESDYDKLLGRSDVDAIICDAPTTQHEDVLIRAANAKKHIFTEKAMAPTVKECNNIAKAVNDNGVTFVISLPQRCSPVVQFAKKLIANGDFGKISLMRIRNGHSGVSSNGLPEYWFDVTKAAGGSLMDLGCHPVYTSCYLLGKPKKISAMLTNYYGKPVDEAASASILFENDAVCTVETSFVTFNTPSSFEIYGSDATLISHGRDNIKFTSKVIAEYANGYVTPKLPQALPTPINAFVDACINGTGSPEGFGVQDGIDLTLLLENAYVSQNTGKIVDL